MSFRYASFDIETTGLDPEKHSLVEIGIVLDDLKNQIPIEKLPRFHAYVLPPTGQEYVGSPFALSLHSGIFKKVAKFIANAGKPVIPEDTFITEDQVAIHVRRFFEENDLTGKVNAAGKNFAGFDLPFLKKRANILKEVEFNHRVIDPAILYFDPNKDQSLPDSKECVARMNKRFGLSESEEVAHTAIEDAIMIVKLLRNGTRKI